MARLKDFNWNMSGTDEKTYSVEAIKVNVMMDLRDELKELNRHMGRVANLLGCRNFTTMPATLRGIRKLMTPPAPAKKKRRRK